MASALGLGRIVIPLGLVLMALGCGGGSATDTDPGASSTPIVTSPGSSCEPVGSTAEASDGCNTCTCTEDGWACTEKACVGNCTEGASRPSSDGCNTCTCSDGVWACTLRGCVDDPSPVTECPEAREPEEGMDCTQAIVYAQSPDGGLCCEYSNGCAPPEGWETFGSEVACQGKTSGSDCTVGETKQLDCNSCTCTESGWACTTMACPPDEPTTCGGIAGLTCADDEYCAYEPADNCGAGDAASTCKPRPQACDTEYSPVCGCDGETHSNACFAAMAGTAVASEGACESS